MMRADNLNKVDVAIVGAGPAGLSAALVIKKYNPELDVCVIEKSSALGCHNLSGAALEKDSIHKLLNIVFDNEMDFQTEEVLSKTIEKDEMLFFPDSKHAIGMDLPLTLARLFKVSVGKMYHKGDYIVSVSELSKWLGKLAQQIGVEVLCGFSVEDIDYDSASKRAGSIIIKEQGLDQDGNQQPNYVPSQKVEADYILLAEGCDGYVTEKFIDQADLTRETVQLYSLGVKELIKVSDEQYRSFTEGRVVHALGYPLWTPAIGPAVFGGGVMYPMGENKIAVGMIAALDWEYYNFNPQEALVRFKEHKYVKKFIDGGKVVEAGAKMIPEGGLRAVPRDVETNHIGVGNVAILGDSAGFVNMIKIKGIHNAIESGIAAGLAVEACQGKSGEFAKHYTANVENVLDELRCAQNFRQTIGKFGPLVGLPLSSVGNVLPSWKADSDYKKIQKKQYRYKLDHNFDKSNFTFLAGTKHREDQPNHLTITDPQICAQKCVNQFETPCITFCPAGVYEMVDGVVKSANPSNCLHCKTCQRKCPFDNIRWNVPEGSGGPSYTCM